jgi:hypothetical protein
VPHPASVPNSSLNNMGSQNVRAWYMTSAFDVIFGSTYRSVSMVINPTVMLVGMGFEEQWHKLGLIWEYTSTLCAELSSDTAVRERYENGIDCLTQFPGLKACVSRSRENWMIKMNLHWIQEGQIYLHWSSCRSENGPSRCHHRIRDGCKSDIS